MNILDHVYIEIHTEYQTPSKASVFIKQSFLRIQNISHARENIYSNIFIGSFFYTKQLKPIFFLKILKTFSTGR